MFLKEEKILPRRITGNCAKTSESSYSSYQESKTYRFNAIRSGLIEPDTAADQMAAVFLSHYLYGKNP